MQIRLNRQMLQRSPHRKRSRQVTALRKALAGSIRNGRLLDKHGWGLTNDEKGLSRQSFWMPVNLPRLIAQKLNPKRKIRVMDLGCQQGNTLLDLFNLFGERADYWGTSLRLNPNWKNVQEKSNQKIHFKVAMAETIAKKFKRESFDIIYSNMGVMHSSNLDLSISQIQSLLRPNGLLIINLGKGHQVNVHGLVMIKRVQGKGTTYVFQKI